MGKTIDDIVNCNISIESPTTSEASMSGLLLLIKGLPETDGSVKYYTELGEIKSDGYGEETDVYRAAAVAFAQDPAPDGIYIAPVKTDEEPTETLDRAFATDGWYNVLPIDIDHKKYNALAVYMETKEKLLGISLAAGEVSPILQQGLMRTHVWRLAGNQTTDYDKFLHVAIASKISSYAPGSETWAFKQLALVTAGVFTSTEITTMDEANENYFVCIAKKNITQGGKTLGGEWIDIIRFRDWLKNQIQLNIYNVKLTNLKIPFTDGGITVIENALIKALKAGQAAGGISPDFYDSDGNKTPGYKTYAPLASSFTAAQKKSRQLTGLKWSAYLAGAIHVTKLSGKLGY